MPPPKYTVEQWSLLERDFIAGKGHFIELCNRHNINYFTARNRAKAENWPQKRAERKQAVIEEYAPPAKAVTVVIDQPGLATTPERALEFRQRYDAMLDRLLSGAEKLCDECGNVAEVDPGKAASALTAAVRAAEQVQDMLGIPKSGSRKPPPLRPAGGGLAALPMPEE